MKISMYRAAKNIGQTFGLGLGSSFLYFKVIDAASVEVSEWNGYDIRRTTVFPVKTARAIWAENVKRGYTLAKPGSGDGAVTL